jgi:hypothetical protein
MAAAYQKNQTPHIVKYDATVNPKGRCNGLPSQSEKNPSVMATAATVSIWRTCTFHSCPVALAKLFIASNLLSNAN